MLKYDQFLREVANFIEEGDRLFLNKQRSHESPDFRKWRVRLEIRLEQAQREYEVTVPVNSSSRNYGGGFADFDIDVAYTVRQFDRDLSDTLNELRLILDHHKTDGEPPRRNESNGSIVASGVPVKPSDTRQIVDWRWMWDQADKPSLLKWVCSVFIIGFALGAFAANKFDIDGAPLLAWIIDRLPGF